MTDAINLASALINGGADPRAWPATKAITGLRTGTGGIDVDFDGADWPDIKPAGWDGPVYYTLWLGCALDDGVHLAASLNVYRGQQGAGAGDVTNIGQYSANLWYLDPALKAHGVKEGDTLYAMVTAGGLRGVSAVSVQQRSNVVAFTANSHAMAFTYDAAQPPIVVPPVVVPDPPSVPTVPDFDLVARLAQFESLLGEIAVNQSAILDLLKKLPVAGAAPDYTGSGRVFGATFPITLTPVVAPVKK